MKLLKGSLVIVAAAVMAVTLWIGSVSTAQAMQKVERKVVMTAEKPIHYAKNIRANERKEKQTRREHRHHFRGLHHRHHQKPS